MRLDKLTSKFQLAISDAQSLALGRDHQYIEATHLMLALLNQDGGSIRPILADLEIDLNQLRSRLSAELERIQGHFIFALHHYDAAIEAAKKKGIAVVALTGKDGGQMAGSADVEIRVPHFGYADRIQEIHIKVIHIIIRLIEIEMAN